MARLPRPDLPGIPQHIVQRGNNRLPCFLDDDDRQRYLQCLLGALPRKRCQGQLRIREKEKGVRDNFLKTGSGSLIPF